MLGIVKKGPTQMILYNYHAILLTSIRDLVKFVVTFLSKDNCFKYIRGCPNKLWSVKYKTKTHRSIFVASLPYEYTTITPKGTTIHNEFIHVANVLTLDTNYVYIPKNL